MIILDLDDTIFKTSTINRSIFDSAIHTIKGFYQNATKYNSDTIINELWERPIDVVFNTYSTPIEIREEVYVKISEINYHELEIKPFCDYSVIKEYGMKKLLVTTGLTEMQNAKIDALGIRNDFEAIFIDDPRTNPRINKFQIFEGILNRTGKKPDQVWVIGDNPESEIEAAHRLGINTIQRKSETKRRSEIANYYIESFNELSGIFNQKSADNV